MCCSFCTVFAYLSLAMAPSSTCAEALVEILNLCEQTLTALRKHEETHVATGPADKYRQSRLQKRANFARLVLIEGGLSNEIHSSRVG
jgi:hypothetical protein